MKLDYKKKIHHVWWLFITWYSHKVEWMYSGDKIDRDAYLLGKPIDKLLIEKEIDKRKYSDTVKFVLKLVAL